jgi:hypothetical protein
MFDFFQITSKMQLFLLALSFLVPIGSTRCQELDENLLRSLFEKTLSNWEQATHQAGKMRGTFTLKEIDHLSNDNISMDAKGEFKACNGFHLDRFQLEKIPKGITSHNRPSSSSIHGMNSKYKFTLESAPGKDSWVVSGLLAFNDQSAANWPPPVPVGYTAPLWHFLVCYRPIAEIIQDPNFTVVSISAIDCRSNLIKLSYEYKYPPSERVDNGYALLDPEAFWCVKEQKVEQRLSKASVVTLKSNNQYHSHANDFPVLDRTLETFEWVKDGNIEARRQKVYEFSFQLVDDIPEEEFTLSAFGLPEPFASVSPGPRYHSWIATGAGISGLLAFIFAWLARKVKGPQSLGRKEVSSPS